MYLKGPCEGFELTHVNTHSEDRFNETYKWFKIAESDPWLVDVVVCGFINKKAQILINVIKSDQNAN